MAYPVLGGSGADYLLVLESLVVGSPMPMCMWFAHLLR